MSSSSRCGVYSHSSRALLAARSDFRLHLDGAFRRGSKHHSQKKLWSKVVVIISAFEVRTARPTNDALGSSDADSALCSVSSNVEPRRAGCCFDSGGSTSGCCCCTSAGLLKASVKYNCRFTRNNGCHSHCSHAGTTRLEPPSYHQLWLNRVSMPFEPDTPSPPCPHQSNGWQEAIAGYTRRHEPAERICL